MSDAPVIGPVFDVVADVVGAGVGTIFSGGDGGSHNPYTGPQNPNAGPNVSPPPISVDNRPFSAPIPQEAPTGNLTPPPIPRPPSPVPYDNSPESIKAAEKTASSMEGAAAAERKTKGRASTIFTSGKGLTSAPITAKRKLFGS